MVIIHKSTRSRYWRIPAEALPKLREPAVFKVSSGKKRTAFRYAGQTKTAQSHQTRRLSAVLSQVPEREIVWCAILDSNHAGFCPNLLAKSDSNGKYNFPSGADSIANGVQKPCLRRLSLSPNLVFLPIRRETHGCQLPRSSCRQQISQSHWPRCLRIVGLKYSRQKNGKNVEFIARWDWEERIKPRHSQALDCPR